MKNFFKTHLVVLLCVCLPGVAFAATGLDAVEAAIKADKKANQDMYNLVGELRAEALQMDATKRGRYAVMGPTLESLGPNAHLALVEDLLADPPFPGASATVRRGWRVGVLHALGRARNADFEPVFVQVMRTETDAEVVKAASSALGKMLSDSAATTLIQLASTDNKNAAAVIAGMGTCRRASVATFLAGRLDSSSPNDQLPVVLALRDVGNAWAWKTTVVAASGEGEATRNTAAAALIEAIARLPSLEQELTKAILIVDAPNTNALLRAQLKSATPPAQTALQRVLKRTADNPLTR